ncbi:MAG: GNAT family N-acetyltransferase [Paracoccaceae bacterium]
MPIYAAPQHYMDGMDHSSHASICLGRRSSVLRPDGLAVSCLDGADFADWSQDLCAHYLRLDAPARRRRFFATVGDAAVRKWCRRYAPVFACVIRDGTGAIRAAAPVHVHGGDPEIAFSVEMDWRQRGYARRLAQAAQAQAGIRGYPHLVVTTQRDNIGMISVMRKLGGDLVRHNGEIRMKLPAHRPLDAGRTVDLADRTLKTGPRHMAQQMERRTENSERNSAA